MNIAVVGTGYVGLVTGTCFAETGNQVVCVDIDEEKVKKMQSGVVPIYEPHLDVLFHRNIKQQRLSFTTNLEEAVAQSTIIFLALPTPPGENDEADLSYVLDVAEKIGKIIKDYKIIVDKSTVPVGTAEKVKAQIAKNAKCEFDVVSNPEFLKEGYAVDDFLKPERVIIGSSSQRANQIMEELYKPFVRQGNPIIFMDEKSAELTKYAANAFLATKITFMNEIANFCEKVGADVDMVRVGIGSDSRIGKRFLFPGVGYGGSCFPKDVNALIKSGEKVGNEFKILKSVVGINENQKIILINKLKQYYNNLEGLTIAVWGLSFKPETDDIREAPALYIIDELLKSNAKVKAYDPEAMENVKNIYHQKIQYGNNPYDVLENADALLICTEWQVFRNPDFDKVKSLMKKPVIFDGRNLYDLKKMQQLNFYYNSIGRNTINNI
ncbi:MAG: UDP-glucose/GDP-mannose dehydrogenase family protein [Vicingaceae bacterium]